MFLQDDRYPLGGFREILEGLPQAVVVFDRAGRLRFANRAAVDLFVHRDDGDEIANSGDLFRLIGPLRHLDGSPLADAEHPRTRLENGESFQDYELRAEERWGSRYPVFSFAGRTVVEAETGEPLRVLTLEDVSDKHESERLFRTAFERGPVPVTIVRHSDQCVLDVNPAFLELLGYERDDVVRHTVPELALILNPEELRNARERIERGEEVEKLELVVRGRDNSPRTMLSWHRWVEVGGEECLLGVYLDITEQKALERKLHEATEVVLQSASMFSRSVVQQLERLRAPDRGSVVSGEIDLLTRREREVVTRVGAGHSNLRIADELALTPQTVRNYVTRIYRKIGVDNRAEAVVWARERGLVQG